MHLSNEIDLDAVDALTIQIGRLINDNDELTIAEILTACMRLIADVIVTVECPGCRRQTEETVKRELPGFIASALAAHRNSVPIGDHLH